MLQAVLADLGMLEGKCIAEARQFTATYMRMADEAAAARGDGVSFVAFCKLYETLVMNRARQQLRFKMGLQVEGEAAAGVLLLLQGWTRVFVRAHLYSPQYGPVHCRFEMTRVWL